MKIKDKCIELCLELKKRNVSRLSPERLKVAVMSFCGADRHSVKSYLSFLEETEIIRPLEGSGIYEFNYGNVYRLRDDSLAWVETSAEQTKKDKRAVAKELTQLAKLDKKPKGCKKK